MSINTFALITLRQDAAVRHLIETALDERHASKALRKALNRVLREFDHDCAYPNKALRDTMRLAGI